MLVDAVRLTDLDVVEAGVGRWRSYSARVSAPAMQPTSGGHVCRVASSMSWSATTSETAKRPPGLSTRAVSRSTCGLSPERLITQLEMTTSTVSAGSGIASMWPLSQLDVLDAGLAWLARARSSISSVMSRP